MNVTKIILTKCKILHLKCTKFNFGWDSAPDPAEGAYSAPQTPCWILGSGKEMEGERMRRGKGKGGKREGKGKEEGRSITFIDIYVYCKYSSHRRNRNRNNGVILETVTNRGREMGNFRPLQ